ncbi:MAG: hypothetical protein HY897_25590 [Deltaproteobacteria bacterium]|nr:hypothetical protein [Deltaproteobacteria bacterium]
MIRFVSGCVLATTIVAALHVPEARAQCMPGIDEYCDGSTAYMCRGTELQQFGCSPEELCAETYHPFAQSAMGVGCCDRGNDTCMGATVVSSSFSGSLEFHKDCGTVQGCGLCENLPPEAWGLPAESFSDRIPDRFFTFTADVKSFVEVKFTTSPNAHSGRLMLRRSCASPDPADNVFVWDWIRSGGTGFISVIVDPGTYYVVAAMLDVTSMGQDTKGLIGIDVRPVTDVPCMGAQVIQNSGHYTNSPPVPDELGTAPYRLHLEERSTVTLEAAPPIAATLAHSCDHPRDSRIRSNEWGELQVTLPAGDFWLVFPNVSFSFDVAVEPPGTRCGNPHAVLDTSGHLAFTVGESDLLLDFCPDYSTTCGTRGSETWFILDIGEPSRVLVDLLAPTRADLISAIRRTCDDSLGTEAVVDGVQMAASLQPGRYSLVFDHWSEDSFDVEAWVAIIPEGIDGGTDGATDAGGTWDVDETDAGLDDAGTGDGDPQPDARSDDVGEWEDFGTGDGSVPEDVGERNDRGTPGDGGRFETEPDVSTPCGESSSGCSCSSLRCAW